MDLTYKELKSIHIGEGKHTFNRLDLTYKELKYTKIEGILYECAARCKCKHGQKVSEKVPTVRDDYVEKLAEANFNNFKKIYPDLVFDLVKKIAPG